MKVIDLLNKIANGEEVPKKIIINGEMWVYDEIDYRASDDRGYLFEVHTRTNCQDLNEQVEILEEKKMPEKLTLHTLSNNDSADFTTLQDFNNRDIQRTINWILDYLKNKGE